MGCNMQFKRISMIIMSSILIITTLSGCDKEDSYPITNNKDIKVMNKGVKYEKSDSKEMSEVLTKVITDKKILTLTFQGLGNEESLKKLLDELDKYNIKATFFVSGVKVVEDKELAKMIVDRGHEIGNDTLSGADLTSLDFNNKMIEIEKSEEIIEDTLGIDVEYLRVGHNKTDDEVKQAAFQGGSKYIISYEINPQDWMGKSPEEISDFVFEKKKRGAIVSLSLDKNPEVYKSIELIYNKLKTKKFELVSLKDLIDIHEEWQKNRFILDEKWYEKYLDNSDFNMIQNGSRYNNKVVLTIDDWATDDTVDEILDILDRYNVKATFFLRAKGVESNPSLAYAIAQRGHEVASHTYNHIDLDTLTEEEIREDLIKSHEVISHAINKEALLYLRPPRGIMNDEIAKVAAGCGYKDIIMYGPTALDWDVNKSAEDITNSLLSQTYSGEIILIHILDGIHTGKALPAIIEGVRAKGYEFITVGEMIRE